MTPQTIEIAPQNKDLETLAPVSNATSTTSVVREEARAAYRTRLEEAELRHAYAEMDVEIKVAHADLGEASSRALASD